MYKDQLQGKKEEKENTEYTVLYEIKENEIPKVPKIQEQQQVPQTLASVRRNIMLSRPLGQFSSSMYQLLMTDSSELECYEEVMQVETRKKWERDMNEEMESLIRNQTWDLVEFPLGKRALKNKWVYRLKEERQRKEAVQGQTCCKWVCTKERYRI